MVSDFHQLDGVGINDVGRHDVEGFGTDEAKTGAKSSSDGGGVDALGPVGVVFAVAHRGIWKETAAEKVLHVADDALEGASVGVPAFAVADDFAFDPLPLGGEHKGDVGHCTELGISGSSRINVATANAEFDILKFERCVVVHICMLTGTHEEEEGNGLHVGNAGEVLGGGLHCPRQCAPPEWELA